jgi:hypothetical protein
MSLLISFIRLEISRWLLLLLLRWLAYQLLLFAEVIELHQSFVDFRLVLEKIDELFIYPRVLCDA